MQSRALTITVIVSVGLNLLLIGLIAGAALRDRPPRANGSPMVHMSVPWLLAGLPDERKRELHAASGDTARDLRRRVHEGRQLQHRVHELLEAEELDVAALESSLAELRGNLNRSQEDMHAVLVRLAREMTVEERSNLMQSARRGPRGGKLHRRPHPEAGTFRERMRERHAPPDDG